MSSNQQCEHQPFTSVFAVTSPNRKCASDRVQGSDRNFISGKNSAGEAIGRGTLILSDLVARTIALYLLYNF